MQPLIWETRPDGLRAPALVCAFSGWNDAGDAASAALMFIAESLGAERFARIDPEDFYDLQVTRPHIGFTEQGTRRITWPQVEIYAARVPGAPRDLILVQGPEPSMRWRSFSRHIVDLAEALGTQLVVTIGALLTDVPHTWPVPITGLASDEALVRKLALTPTTYEGPTGIVGVLHTAFAEAGMPSASLWASVPRYLPGGPNPKAALALVRAVEGLVAVAVDASDLELASSEFERQLGLAVESNPKARAIVENLEQAIGEESRALDPEDLPSGDMLAREIQRFLRQQEPDR